MSVDDVQKLVDEVKTILNQRFSIPLDKLTASASIKDLGLDSLQILDITMEMEDRLGRRLEDMTLPRDPTIQDVATMIHQNIIKA
jgi:acyl carrier protein